MEWVRTQGAPVETSRCFCPRTKNQSDQEQTTKDRIRNSSLEAEGHSGLHAEFLGRGTPTPELSAWLWKSCRASGATGCFSCPFPALQTRCSQQQPKPGTVQPLQAKELDGRSWSLGSSERGDLGNAQLQLARLRVTQFQQSSSLTQSTPALRWIHFNLSCYPLALEVSPSCDG